MPQHLDPNPTNGQLWKCPECEDYFAATQMETCDARNCEGWNCKDCISKCRDCGKKFCASCKRRGCITDGICEACEQ